MILFLLLHSYYFVCENEQNILATSFYGSSLHHQIIMEIFWNTVSSRKESP